MAPSGLRSSWAMSNAAQLVKRFGPDEPRLRRALETIERQVAHQTHLLDDLLDVSRITRGKIQLQHIHIELGGLIRDTAEDRRGDLEAAGLTLNLEMPEVPVWVNGDPVRLAQVIGNLIHNAAKFTDPGGHITLRLVAAPEVRLATLTVRDTGIGIDADMLLHVFDTFAQADRSLDRSRGGLGLGLALVKGLVELHKGTVWAYSEGTGRGAEFNVLLPITSGPEKRETSPPLTATGPGPNRILIIEDNPDVAQTLRELLEWSGCTVAVAYTGPAGVELAREFQPDVVLCDLGLPGMDGFQVAIRLRQDPDLALVRLIAVTGYGQEEDRRRSREAGFDRHLTKPVDFAELLQMLRVPVERHQD
jgi:CheY-like chemotaxis protein